MNGSSDVNGKAPLPIPGAASPIAVQPPRQDDLQPSYAKVVHGDSGSPDEHGWYGSMIANLGSVVGSLGAVPGCICCPNPYRKIAQGQVGLVSRFGKFTRACDPGLVKINPLSESLIQVDVKIQIVEVPKQVCITMDNVTLSLTSVIYYHIISPHKAAFGISNLRQALVERTQTTLRHVVGARVLQDVIERREEIAQSIREIIEETAIGWGANVESMLVKDIVFSQELQDSLSLAAAARRAGDAKIITAKAEVESARLMRTAADILNSSAAMQIRYLEAMQAMAKSSHSKVIFLPAMNQTAMQQITASAQQQASSSSTGNHNNGTNNGNEDAFDVQGVPGFQDTLNSQILENI